MLGLHVIDRMPLHSFICMSDSCAVSKWLNSTTCSNLCYRLSCRGRGTQQETVCRRLVLSAMTIETRNRRTCLNYVHDDVSTVASSSKTLSRPLTFPLAPCLHIQGPKILQVTYVTFDLVFADPGSVYNRTIKTVLLIQNHSRSR